MIGRYGNLNIYREIMNSRDFIRFAVATLLIPCSFIFRYASFQDLTIADAGLETILLIISASINGIPIIAGAVKGIIARRINVDELVSLALIACFLNGEFFEAATVAAIMVFGSILEEAVSESTRSSIRKLIEMIPANASIERNGVEVKVPLSEIRPGDIMVTRPGEIIAVDAVILLQ